MEEISDVMSSRFDKLMQLKKEREKKEIETGKKARKINPKWERAVQFCNYVGLKPERSTVVFILGLCRRYGEGKTYAMESFLKDANWNRDDYQKFLLWRVNGGGLLP